MLARSGAFKTPVDDRFSAKEVLTSASLLVGKFPSRSPTSAITTVHTIIHQSPEMDC